MRQCVFFDHQVCRIDNATFGAPNSTNGTPFERQPFRKEEIGVNDVAALTCPFWDQTLIMFAPCTREQRTFLVENRCVRIASSSGSLYSVLPVLDQASRCIPSVGS
jgi:hypothetical protein